ncbi:MAG: RNA polymerase sigma factor [Acidobacteriota bacterium]
MFDERELSNKIASGNTQAFAQWYRADAPRLRLFLRRLVGNEQAAEDLMQETFIQIWRRPQGFDPERGSPRAYLFGTARNLAAGWLRKQKPSDELQTEPVLTDPVEGNSIVADALSRLELDDRTILWLREVEGHSYAELAAMLNIPIGTVRSRLHNAREALRAVWHSTQRPAGGSNELR